MVRVICDRDERAKSDVRGVMWWTLRKKPAYTPQVNLASNRDTRGNVVIRVWTPGFVLPAAVGISCFWYLLSHLHQAPVLRVSLPGRVHDVVSTLLGTKPRPAETRKISIGDCAAQFEVFPHRRIGRYVRTFGCVRAAREGFDKIPTSNVQLFIFTGIQSTPSCLPPFGWGGYRGGCRKVREPVQL